MGRIRRGQRFHVQFLSSIGLNFCYNSDMDTHTKKVLVVEDDKDYRGLLVDKLTLEGYSVLEAADGIKGLAIALQEHPDLILLDIMMPVMTGLQVLEKLREDSWGKTASVFLLTNVDPDDNIMEKVAKYTPSYYLLKKGDILPDEIAEKIREKFR